MQISGVEKLNSKHILFDLYNLCAYGLQFKKNFVIYVNLYCLTYPPLPKKKSNTVLVLDWTFKFVLQMSSFALFAVV